MFSDYVLFVGCAWRGIGVGGGGGGGDVSLCLSGVYVPVCLCVFLAQNSYRYAKLIICHI